MAQIELPFVTMLTPAEVSQAIGEYVARRQMGIDLAACAVAAKVTFRQVPGPDGSSALNAAVAVTSVEALPADRVSG